MVKIDLLTVSERSARPLVAALIYCALREARIVGRTLAEIEPGDHWETVCELLRLPRLRSADETVRQRVDYGMHCAFAGLGAELQSVLADTFPSEVVRTIENCLERFFAGGAWAKTIRQGALSRRQYVATLFNLHSYVRYTTRLLGHCIGIADDRSLRTHYIEHLKGEINHEVIIERDLKYLGEDVDYVVQLHQPTPSVLGFLCIQESIVAFDRDAILFLACPIAAESFAAYIQEDILEGLKRSIRGWGLENPADVIHFVKSHSGFDGGPEGHWNRCIEITKNYVRSEVQMQRFSSIVHAAMSALAKNLDSCVLEHAEPDAGQTVPAFP